MNDSKVQRLKLPTLIITGSEDRLLPSKLEGRRLKGLLSAVGGTVELREMPASGHALMDDSFNLAALLRDSKTFRSDFNTAPTPASSSASASSSAAAAAAASPYSVPMPTQEDLDLIDKQLDGFVKALSPVYLSRDKVKQQCNDYPRFPLLPANINNQHNHTTGRHCCTGSSSRSHGSGGSAGVTGRQPPAVRVSDGTHTLKADSQSIISF